MADKEKTIACLECRAENKMMSCTTCPYKATHDGFAVCDFSRLCRDALELLKAQEPVEPIIVNGSRYIYCGNCKRPLCNTSDDYIPAYCEECGREVKWG